MKSLQNYIDQMDSSLDSLIDVATQLRDMSLQVISEEDLALLQKKQEDLIQELETIDQHIQSKYKHQLDTATKSNFHKKIETFQGLNQEFIENLNTSHGLIQFDLRRFAEEESISSLPARLNKILPAPNSSKAVKSEKHKKT